jgi:hypothetical protein
MQESLMKKFQIIAERLKGTAIEAFWAGTSFLLCSTGALVPTVFTASMGSPYLTCDLQSSNQASHLFRTSLAASLLS